MDIDVLFIVKSVLFGIALAMDAFSVSLANGLNEPCMKERKMLGIAGVFAGFQAIMPLIGWVCIHTIVRAFKSFESFIPWIALILLSYIGGKMIYDGRCKKEEEECSGVGFWALIVQGVATSIDALSVGFDIAKYSVVEALVCAAIIALVTFFICYFGIIIGKKFGVKLANKAQYLGGTILILIGIEIFISNLV